MLSTGDTVPDLPLALGDGSSASLRDYRGRWLVLYFYPKDNTPGCTREGQDFAALYPKLRKAGAEVLGVSRDSVKSHANFGSRYEFPFQLASDRDEALCIAFGVIREKVLYGRRYMGVERSTFLIDPDGRIHREWRGVKVPGHTQAVLDALKAA